MTEENPRPDRKLELSPAQITGSALAAVSAAFFASWAGTAGTLIGAALGSLFATAGAAMYTWWLRRTSEAVRRTATQVRSTGMGSTVVVPSLARTSKGARSAGAGGDPAPDASEASGEGAVGGPVTGLLRGRPWGKLALATAGVLLMALASITVVEAVTGKPLSAYTRGSSASGTSVGHLVGSDTSTTTPRKQQSTPTPTPTPTPTSTPSQQSTPTQAPTPTPTITPTPTPAVPTPTPTGTPQGAQTPGPSSSPAP